MKKLLAITGITLALAACGVDTTGISAQSSKTPNPKTNPNAAVVVQEYGDLQCPACRAAQSLIVHPLLEKYGQQIRFEYHQFPLSSVHQNAMIAAEASECAADQGKFWEFVDLDYEKQDELSKQALDDWGKQLGLNMDLYTRCRQSHIKRATIQAEYDQGRNMGITGTPTFFVNGEQVESTIDALSAAIEAKLQSTTQKL